MTGSSVFAEHDGLTGLSTILRNGAGDLADAAMPVTDPPDAGRSSANVGAALAAIVRSMALLIAQSERTAAQINANNGAYGDVDNQTATGLHELEGQLLEPN
ncbi:MAG TPA: hypothetical protein VFX16_08560 [Pseudonocardiaceae bacterium]|nr:hypothetical protein [Pseudonocardiaceae bacterium]